MGEFINPELDGDSSEQQQTTPEERLEARRRMLELGMERIDLGLDPLTGEEQKPFSQVGEEGRERARNRRPTSAFQRKNEEG